MNNKIFNFILCGVMVSSVVLINGGAYGYEEVPVKDGGTLEGIVKLEGPVPEPRVFPVVLYPFSPYCKKNSATFDGKGNIILREIRVDSDQGLKDVVVAIEGIEKGKRFEPIVPEIISRECEFLPFVNVVQNHGKFIMKNDDPVLHNSQLYQAGKGNVILNVPIPPNSTMEHPIEMEQGRRISQMICGMHEFMHTWGFAVENPYYFLTGSDGAFIIEEIPPGNYNVTIWHPSFDLKEKEITVPPKGKVRLEIEFDSSEVERAAYESQEKFRIQSE